MPAATSVRRLALGPGAVALAVSCMNVLTYAFTVLVARQVAPAVFGEVTALMGVLLVGSVASLGLQATAARRVATCEPAHRAALIVAVRRATYVLGAAVSVVVALLSPALVRLLALDDVLPTLLVALTLLPLTVFGAQAGVAQGAERWRRLAALYVAVGLGRVLGGAVGAMVSPTATGALAGVLVGSLAPVVVGWSLLHPPSDGAGPTRPRALLVETLLGSQALLAFFALSNADAVLARALLSPADSGLYAAGLIVTKAALFLPQFVAVVAFPSLARGDRPGARLLALATVAGLGVSAALGTWVLPDLALAFAGGSRYAGVVELLPLFALQGAVLALVHLLVYDSLAQRSARLTLALWGLLGAVVVAAVTVVDGIVALTLTMTAAGVLACAAPLLLRSRRAGHAAG